jgi:predicted transposase YdaD
LPGEALLAPGVLKNPVLVEALYDREAAHEATLRNLLQRRGYEDIEAVREEGRDEGRKEGRNEGRKEGRNEGRKEGHTQGLRIAVRDLCEVLGVALSPEREATLEAMAGPELSTLREQLKRERRWP